MIRAGLLAAAALLPPSAARETPIRFVTRVYAGYSDPRFSPLDHKAAIFSPRLSAAIAEDARLAQGEVGYLDGDPLCDCQDASGLKARVTKVVRGRGGTDVIVSIDLGEPRPRSLRLKLVPTGRVWRVDDIASPSEPSLLNALTRSNQAGVRR
ncbi:DUF3828 domain-containing protein [Sphingomonas tabacisoli]|uniref:DUF3828 domain-containing protein n=1 Tax=Sphingomonas tabacisoli TaxID=2249466 RepID=A0ABW4HZD3_9SPHN